MENKKEEKARGRGGKRPAGRQLLARSRLFRRSFLTYLIMILAFLVGYLVLILFDYNTNQKKDLEARFTSEARLAGSLIDNRLREAKITATLGI